MIDPRLVWLGARACSSLQVSDDAWTTLIEDEEQRMQVEEFADNPDSRRLFLMRVSAGGTDVALVATTNPQHSGLSNARDGSAMYFVKLMHARLTNKTDLSTEVTYDVMATGVLEHLSMLSHELFLPLVSNPANQDWPELVSKELLDHFHKLLGTLYVTIGQTNGKTLLPMPRMADAVSLERFPKDREKIHILESTVVTWTRQIKTVLKSEPESVLKTNPDVGPLAELNFWVQKAANLNSIQEQLLGDKVRKVLKVLDMTKSTYSPSFSRLCKEVSQARAEANDNQKHLETLRPYLQQVESAEFHQLPKLFRPVMHLIMMVWKHSKHYNTANRLIVLVRELCNELIRKARVFLDASSIFKLDSSIAAERLRHTIKVCGMFKSCYFDYKTKSNTEVAANPWRFQNSVLFHRLDSFLERCHDILDLTQTIVQFSKLERVEIGGSKGKTLSTSVRQIHGDFVHCVGVFQRVSYDVLAVEAKQFDDDFYEFRCAIKELERRLGSVLNQGFDDCTTVGTSLKLLETFEGLLDRELVQTEVQQKEAALLRAYMDDITVVADEFERLRDNPPIPRNMPSGAGALVWCLGLMHRIEEPMAKLKQLNRLAFDSDDSKDITKAFKELRIKLQDYMDDVHRAWAQRVAGVRAANLLRQPLLQRDSETNHVRVNFDGELSYVLREIRYMQTIPNITVSQEVLSLAERTDEYRTKITQLEVITNQYNWVCESLLPVEQPLFADHIRRIDEILERGVSALTWRSHGLAEFITQATVVVDDVARSLNIVKANVAEVRRILSSWTTSLLMDRQEQKTYNTDDFQERHASHLAVRYNEVADGGSEIHRLLAQSNRVLKISRGAPAWKAYLDWINGIVLQGLSETVANSLAFLAAQVDSARLEASETNPLLEIKLELIAPDVQFNPELDEAGGRNGIRDMLKRWVGGFSHIGRLVNKLDSPDATFFDLVRQDERVLRLEQEIEQHARNNEDRCRAYRDSYLMWSYLWTSDLHQAFQDFLGSSDSNEGPDLAAFDDRIGYYMEIKETISQLPNSTNIGWLKVDSKPIKQALSTWVTKWIFIYTQHLINKVTGNLSSISSFLDTVDRGLAEDAVQRLVDGLPELPRRPVSRSTEGGRSDDAADAQDSAAGAGAGAGEATLRTPLERLIEFMTHVRDVSTHERETESLFEPLAETEALLRRYGFLLPESVVARMAGMPARWRTTKEKAAGTKAMLADVRMTQRRTIQQEVAAFRARVEAYRPEFLALAPFADLSRSGGASRAVELMTEAETSLVAMESEMERLATTAELLDVPRSETSFRDIHVCRRELVLLGELWQVRGLVERQYTEWRGLCWNKTPLAELIGHAEVWREQVGRLSAQMHAWEAYKTLRQLSSDVHTVLPLLQDLDSPAMRERHWKALMRISDKTFTWAPDMPLATLFDLRLHRHVEAVRQLLDRAERELSTETALLAIDAAWVSMSLSFVPFRASGVSVLQGTDVIFSTLHDHETTLQAIQSTLSSTSSFADDLTKWQRKLAHIERVLSLWLAAQNAWCSLYGIFHGNADLITAMPSESKAFDDVNGMWSEFVSTSTHTVNVVEACCRERVADTLLVLLRSLEACQASLRDYVQEKRALFPRFYFLDDVALLDVLSRDSDPASINQHISKLFPHAAALDLAPSVEGNPASGLTAHGMLGADDTEVLSFARPVAQTGGGTAAWLAGIYSAMTSALREQVSAAIASCRDNPRPTWFLEYPSQVALVVVQLNWANDVGRRVDLDDGSLSEVAATLTEQLTAVRSIKASLAQQHKVQLMLSFLNAARHVVLDLVEAGDVDTAREIWLSQARYSNTDALTVSFGAATVLPYRFEFLGAAPRVVPTSAYRQAAASVASAVLASSPALISGPAGVGKTATLHDVASVLAAPLFSFACGTDLSPVCLGDLLRGAVQSGAWLLLDGLTSLTPVSANVLAQNLKALAADMATVAKTGGSEDDDEDQVLRVAHHPAVPLHRAGFAVLATHNTDVAASPVPPLLQVQFRSVAVHQPDVRVVLESMLVAAGFLTAPHLALKLTSFVELAESLLPPRAQYDWSLRRMQPVVAVAAAVMAEEESAAPADTSPATPSTPAADAAGEDDSVSVTSSAALAAPAAAATIGVSKEQEESFVLSAVRSVFAPTILPEDRPVTRRILADVFASSASTADSAAALAAYHLPASLRSAIEAAAHQIGLTPTPSFVAKVEMLAAVLQTHRAVALVGPAGSGKTSLWRTLAIALTSIGTKVMPRQTCVAIGAEDVVLGFYDSSQRWNDGILSNQVREACRGSDSARWLVLDGQSDAPAVAALTSLLDETVTNTPPSHTFTLGNQERLSLHPTSRILLETDDVSRLSKDMLQRCAVLSVSPDDLAWTSVLSSWLASLQYGTRERQGLNVLFTRFVPSCIELMQQQQQQQHVLVPFSAPRTVATLCSLLEALLDSRSFDRELFERFFLFSLFWAFAGDRAPSAQQQLSAWVRATWQTGSKALPPSTPSDNVFDWYVDADSGAWTLFSDSPDAPDGSADVDGTVETLKTFKLRYVSELLLSRGRSVLFVGASGSGKTKLLRSRAASQSEDRLVAAVKLDAQHTSPRLLQLLYQSLQCKAGTVFVPRNNKQRLVVSIDDLSAPTAAEMCHDNPHELLRVLLDNRAIPDEETSVLRDVQTASVLATADSASMHRVSGRLLRHFAILHVPEIDEAEAHRVFATVLQAHLARQYEATIDTAAVTSALTAATLEVQACVTQQFRPRFDRFHYQWTIHDVARVFHDMARVRRAVAPTLLQLVRVWVCACERAYADRLVSDVDTAACRLMLRDVSKKYFETLDQDALHKRPLVVAQITEDASEAAVGSGSAASNISGNDEGRVDAAGDEAGDAAAAEMLVPSIERLAAIQAPVLDAWNRRHASRPVELFDDTALQVANLARLLTSPQPGSGVLIVGPPSCGKSTLACLASAVAGIDAVVLGGDTAQHTSAQCRREFQSLYLRAGVKAAKVALIVPASRIEDDEFLVLLDGFLNGGEVEGLFSQEERDNICNAVRGPVKQAGLLDSRANCWTYFLSRVSSNMSVVVTMRSTDTRLRKRCARFPDLLRRMPMLRLQPMGSQSLVSVALRCLGRSDQPALADADVRDNIAYHVAWVHAEAISVLDSAAAASAAHGTAGADDLDARPSPRTFLEMLQLYQALLAKRNVELEDRLTCVRTGLAALDKTKSLVAELQDITEHEDSVVGEKRVTTEQLLVQVGQDTAVVDEQNRLVAELEQQLEAADAECKRLDVEYTSALDDVLPHKQQAQDALAGLDKAGLAGLKEIRKPPPNVEAVLACVLIITSSEESGVAQDLRWSASKRMFAAPKFLDQLQAVDYESIPSANIAALSVYLTDDLGNTSDVQAQPAAATLWAWLSSTVLYHKAYAALDGMRRSLSDAQDAHASCEARLSAVRQQVDEVKTRLASLTRNFERATQDKNHIISQASGTTERLAVAQELVELLEQEEGRWREQVVELEQQQKCLVGDALLAAAFVAYAGPLNSDQRTQRLLQRWGADLREREIATSAGLDAIAFLTSPDARLPRCVLENAAIVENATRWPLLIDPHGEGLAWVRQREHGRRLRRIEISHPDACRVLEHAVVEGDAVVVAGVTRTLHPMLVSLLQHNVVTKGRRRFIRLSDGREIEYDPEFRLYLVAPATVRLPGRLSSLATVVNFGMTQDSLQQSIVHEVARTELPDVAEHLTTLQNDVAAARADLEKQETQFLQHLANKLTKRLVAQPGREHLHALADARDTAVKLQQGKQETAAALERLQSELDTTRTKLDALHGVARRVALLFSVVDHLESLHPLYCESLDGFRHILDQALAASGNNAGTSGDAASPERAGVLMSRITSRFLTAVTRCMPVHDRQAFTAHVVLSILFAEDKLTREQHQFLLASQDATRDSDAAVGKSFCDWLDDGTWRLAQQLSTLSGFDGFSDDLAENAKRWREWYALKAPEADVFPQPWNTKLTPVQQLLVIKCLRPERIVVAMCRLLHAELDVTMSAQRVASATSRTSYSARADVVQDVAELVDRVTAEKPLVLLVPPSGEGDAYGDIVAEAVGANVKRASLTSATAVADADELLAEAMENGGWLFVEHAEASPAWLTSLESVLQEGRWRDGADNGSDEDDDDADVSTDTPPAMPGLALPLLARSSATSLRSVISEHAGQTGATASRTGEDFVHVVSGGGTSRQATPRLSAEQSPRRRSSVLPAPRIVRELNPDAVSGQVAAEAAPHDEDAKSVHPDFRLVLTLALLPASSPTVQAVPRGIVERGIKTCVQSESGLRASVQHALRAIGSSAWTAHTVVPAYRPVVYALAFLHASLTERALIGPSAFNYGAAYRFSDAMLRDAVAAAGRVLSSSSSNAGVDWTALRGSAVEAVYAGGMMNVQDRAIVHAYARTFLRPELLSEGFELARHCPVPPASVLQSASMHSVLQHAAGIPCDSASTLLHASPAFDVNAGTATSVRQMLAVQRQQVALLADRQAAAASGSGVPAASTGVVPDHSVVTAHEKAKRVLDDVLERVPPPISLKRLLVAQERSTSDRDCDPMHEFVLGECRRMNKLLECVCTTLTSLDAVLRADRVMDESDEELIALLGEDKVPPAWQQWYPSRRGLMAWASDLSQRGNQLEEWAATLKMPKTTWLPGLFNMHALTAALKQATARSMGVTYDSVAIEVEVQRRRSGDGNGGDVIGRNVALVSGLVLEGARWERTDRGSELAMCRYASDRSTPLPVIAIKAVKRDHLGAAAVGTNTSSDATYLCPVYRTSARAASYVWQVPMPFSCDNASADTWILAGAAVLLDPSV